MLTSNDKHSLVDRRSSRRSSMNFDDQKNNVLLGSCSLSKFVSTPVHDNDGTFGNVSFGGDDHGSKHEI